MVPLQSRIEPASVRQPDRSETMPDNDLASIKRQIARLETKARRLESAANDRKRKAVQEVLALMKKSGVTLDDLRAPEAGRTASKRAPRSKDVPAAERPKVKVPVKYRNPETGDAWSGRGRTPVWLAALEKQGRTRSEFLVGNA
jgi:DNA-binding protein H-NS